MKKLLGLLIIAIQLSLIIFLGDYYNSLIKPTVTKDSSKFKDLVYRGELETNKNHRSLPPGTPKLHKEINYILP